VDIETLARQFEKIEQEVERLIESCKRLEGENSELKAEIQHLTVTLQGKDAAVRQHDELKDLVRTKIEGLMGRLDELSEEQV
jgi:chromosome segregation ATPase